MNINIYVVGRFKESYYKAMEAEYLKRLSGYCKLAIVELSPAYLSLNPSEKDIEAAKAKEGREILAKLKPNDYLVNLDLGAKEPTSAELSSKLDHWMVASGSHLNFAIGGSYGLSEEAKERANDVLTLSQLTFTHEMARLLLEEQLYRSYRILHHEPYDK